jgi:hypothetical protein
MAANSPRADAPFPARDLPPPAEGSCGGISARDGRAERRGRDRRGAQEGRETDHRRTSQIRALSARMDAPQVGPKAQDAPRGKLYVDPHCRIGYRV